MLAQLRQLVQENPAALQPLIQAIAQSNPQLAEAMANDPEAVLNILAQGGAGGEEDDQVGMVSAVDLRGVESASAWRPCSVLLFAAFTPLTRARGTGRALGGGPGQGAAGA
jgi:hypothetical protein